MAPPETSDGRERVVVIEDDPTDFGATPALRVKRLRALQALAMLGATAAPVASSATPPRKQKREPVVVFEHWQHRNPKLSRRQRRLKWRAQPTPEVR